MADEFSASENWHDFEILAVKFVSIIINNSIFYDDIVFHEVPLTRDHGVDGRITITMKSSKIEFTIEAKLRSRGKLSLKDFASSVVNYFINNSNFHFIITNVQYTDDAIHVVEQINNKYFDCNLICYDGSHLKEIMDKHISLQKDYPVIHKHLSEQSFSANKLSLISPEKKKQTNEFDIELLLDSRKDLAYEIRSSIINKTSLVLVVGPSGTGKSLVIKEALRGVQDNIVNVNLDTAISLRVFAIAIAKSIVNIDIFKLIDLLGDSDKAQLEKDINYYGKNADFTKYMCQILNINLTDDVFGYIIKNFIESVIINTNKNYIFYIHNIHKSTYETASFLFQLIPFFNKHNIQVIIELSDINGHLPFMSEDEYNIISNKIYAIKRETVKSINIKVGEFNNDDALAFLASQQLPNNTLYFHKKVIEKYGYNPLVLYNVSDYIKSNYIFTASEVNAMNINDNSLINIDKIYQTISKYDDNTQQVIVWVLIVAYLSNRMINFELLNVISKKFNKHTLYKTLKETNFFDYKSDGLYVKKYLSSQTLSIFCNINPPNEQATFLLENKHLWNGDKTDRLYTECNLLYITQDNNFITVTEKAISLLERLQCKSMVILLLDKCRLFTDKTSQMLSIKYSIMYLEKIEPEQYFEAKNEKIISETKNKCQLYISSTVDNDLQLIYEYMVRLCVINYKKYRSNFDFFEAEKYINDGLDLEGKCINSKLMNRLYVYKALCIKERGLKKEYLNYFRYGIRKYPNESYIQVCYCSNVASYNFKRNRKKARVYLKKGIQLANNSGHQSLSIWLQHNLAICNLYDKNFNDYNLSQLHNLRYKADRIGSIADISRSYNIEGCILLGEKKYAGAFQCFKNAANLFDKNITEQMIFLFQTNLITTMRKLDLNVEYELNNILNWLVSAKSRIYTKLQNVPVLSIENDYAAIVSLVKTALICNNINFTKILLYNYPFDEIQNIVDEYGSRQIQKLNELVDSAYIKDNEILILF